MYSTLFEGFFEREHGQTVGIVNEKWMNRSNSTRIPFMGESFLAINTQV